MRPGGYQKRILPVIREGYCNTSRDLSDVTGIPVSKCSGVIYNLARMGIVRQTDRYIYDGRFRMRVFEVVT